jgi:hypothetical protein
LKVATALEVGDELTATVNCTFTVAMVMSAWVMAMVAGFRDAPVAAATDEASAGSARARAPEAFVCSGFAVHASSLKLQVQVNEPGEASAAEVRANARTPDESMTTASAA